MPIEIELAPGETLITPQQIMTCGAAATVYRLDDGTRFVRGRDVITAAEATTSCKRLHLLLIVMYLSEERFELETAFMKEALPVMMAAPSTRRYILHISEAIASDQFAEALRWSHELLNHEKMLLESVLGPLTADQAARH